MKKQLFFALLFASSAHAITYTSRPFLSFPTQAPPTGNDLFLFKDYFARTPVPPKKAGQQKQLSKITSKKKAFHMGVFAGRTTNANGITRYLFPFNKTTITVKDKQDDTGTQDILSANFNIIPATRDQFHSELTMNPKQTRFGIDLSGHLQWNKKYWLSFSAPLVHVKNDLNFKENVIAPAGGANTTAGAGFDGGSYLGTMEAAFKATGMKYGKIDGVQKETRIADITLNVGYNFLREKKRYVQPYIGCVIPTGNKPNAEYLFEAIVGNNQHFGFQLGTQFGMQLRKTSNRSFWVQGRTETQYLAPNTQKRSLDLAGKPWSRYLGIYATETKRAAGNSNLTDMTWGINHFTQDVRVAPHTAHTFQVGITSYCTKNYSGTLGYKAYVRHAETVELKNSWVQGPQISGLDFSPVSTTSPGRGINTVLANFGTTEAHYVTADHLDLAGAAHPFSADHTIYATLNKKFTRAQKTFFAELGGNYTFGSNNATPHRWELLANIVSYF